MINVFGPAELEQYRVDRNPYDEIAKHPHDYLAQPRLIRTLRSSSAKQHMHIDRVVPGVINSRKMGRSTQTGSHFDTPLHYAANGSPTILHNRVQGAARVVDLRPFLEKLSDGNTITPDVVRAYIEAAIDKGILMRPAKDKKDLNNPVNPSWERILLLTLSKAQHQSATSLDPFPHFDSSEAAGLLIDGITEHTGVAPCTLYHEPASVDATNQGHLACHDEGGKGGAHGALSSRNVIIGENWNLGSKPYLTDGATAVMLVFFDQSMRIARDSVPVAGAYCVPTQKIQEVQDTLLPFPKLR